ncbi:MAG: 50S ribosomal protein L25 [Patescibacteria group bacterium]|nr:50S ribosomal protein L25 [Patescibacteria group bacterium]
MFSITAKKRNDEKPKDLRGKNLIPAILYGPKIKNLNIKVDLKEFEKVYKETGLTSLISLKIEGEGDKFSVLIHDVQLDPLMGNPIHIDFYQPSLKEEIETTIPIVLEGEAAAVKNLGGTLVKGISEIEVKALPQDLPKEIKLNIESLKSFEDKLLIEDLQLPKGVKAQRPAEEILASVLPPEKVEEELEKPIEEKVEEVEKVEVKKEEEVEEEKKGKKPAPSETTEGKEKEK